MNIQDVAVESAMDLSELHKGFYGKIKVGDTFISFFPSFRMQRGPLLLTRLLSVSLLLPYLKTVT